ncbi:MAG: MarR family transcriptional regulator [Clostridia bacterium]|jgi:MarR family transcriptional regulator, 2-MHQ and catechol-resistance regulon repressor|nr:MarR family transcriptional regulator [Clostridia bacterium]
MTTNVKLMVVLSRLNYVFMSRLGKNLESLNMPTSHYLILAHLNDAGRDKVQKLCEAAVITSGTVTHAVSKLKRHGYVVKKQDEDDRRVFWVQITQKGREAYQRVDDKHMAYLKELLGGFSEKEKQDFIRQIKHFGKTIAAEHGERDGSAI